MKKILRKVFGFPRSELESRWWHRMAKILIYGSTVVAVLLVVIFIHFKPYNVYSFETGFSQYLGTYRVENCSHVMDFNFCGESADQLVFKYSSTPSGDTYVTNLGYWNNNGGDAYKVVMQMQQDGLLNNLKAVDLSWNFNESYIKLAVIIILPLLWYLLMIHVVYKTAAYVFVGKREKMI
jgi:hypothetical protein